MDDAPQEVQRLNQLGVSAYFKDVVALILENRPEAPIDFIADYFRTVAKSGSGISRSYRYVRLTQRHRNAFMDNLLSAYMSLDSKLHNSAGLTGREYAKLLRLLCNDFPLDVVESLLSVMGKSSNDPIEFAHFCAGVNACMLYEEFFEQVEWLFKACDTNGNGLIDKRTFNNVVEEMKVNQARYLEQGNSEEAFNIPSDEQLDKALELVIGNANRLEREGANKGEMAFKDFVSAIFASTKLPKAETTSDPQTDDKKE